MKKYLVIKNKDTDKYYKGNYANIWTEDRKEAMRFTNLESIEVEFKEESERFNDIFVVEVVTLYIKHD